MKTAHDIILKPVITENSMAGIADKKYTFKVATDATKVEIAQAVETLFPGAKVAKVNTISVRGRFRRQGMHAGYTAASKKAIGSLRSSRVMPRMLHGFLLLLRMKSSAFCSREIRLAP